jgi:hypothetical protein
MQLGNGDDAGSHHVQPIYYTGILILFLQGGLIKIDVHEKNLA